MRKLMLLAAMVALALVVATPAVAQLGQGFGQENVESGKVEPQVGISSSPDPMASPEAQAPAPQVPAPQAPAQAQVNPKATAEPGKAEAKAGKAEAKAAALPKTGGIAGVTSLLGLGAGALLVAGGLIARRIVR